MIYIDFDGVILDTEDLVLKKYREKYQNKEVSLENKIKYFKRIKWSKVLEKAPIINNSLDYLRKTNIKEVIILTKVFSIDDEGREKIKYLRDNNVFNNVILSPYNLSKNEVVVAKDNILIDDYLGNLDKWVEAGGIGIFFDRKNNGIDNHGILNSKYKSIHNLCEIGGIINE